MSGGSGSAERAARGAEDRRMRQINEGVGQVNALFNSKKDQYDKFLHALRDRYMTDLGEQKTDIDRSDRFGMARKGLTKGSADFDRQARRGDDYLKALVANENSAQAAVGKLRQSDENTRLSLTDMIYGGMDASTASRRALSGQQANAQAAQAAYVPQMLDAGFGGAADAYGTQIANDAYGRGARRARSELYG